MRFLLKISTMHIGIRYSEDASYSKILYILGANAVLISNNSITEFIIFTSNSNNTKRSKTFISM